MDDAGATTTKKKEVLEEPLNLCLKDSAEQFSVQGMMMGTSGCFLGGEVGGRGEAHDNGSAGQTRGAGEDEEGEEEEDEDEEDDGVGSMQSAPEIHSALSVIEQINSLRKFIHEKRLSKFYEMYLMQLRVELNEWPRICQSKQPLEWILFSSVKFSFQMNFRFSNSFSPFQVFPVDSLAGWR